MGMLEEIPTEVLNLIFKEVRFRDLPKVQSTCRVLRSVAWPMLWENLELEFPFSFEQRGSNSDVSLSRYLKRFQSYEVPVLEHPDLHHDARGWLKIREIDLVRLRNCSTEYQRNVLGFVKRFRLIVGSFARVNKSPELSFLLDKIVPAVAANVGLKSVDLGARLGFYRDPDEVISKQVLGKFDQKVDINMEILAGVLKGNMSLMSGGYLTYCANLKVLKIQLRKCFGSMFGAFENTDNRLPQGLETLELTSVSHGLPAGEEEITIESQALRRMLLPCWNALQRLMFKGYFRIIGNQDWLPDAVESLDIAFYGAVEAVELIETLVKPQVTNLVICYQLLSAMGHYEFPNVDYLQIWDIFGEHAQAQRDHETWVTLQSYYTEKLATKCTKIRHLDLGEAFHNNHSNTRNQWRLLSDGSKFDLYTPMYYTYINTFKGQLQSLVSKQPPLYETQNGQMPRLTCFILDSSREQINWKTLVEFIKESKVIKEAYIMTHNRVGTLFDDNTADPLPKFVLRFMRQCVFDKRCSSSELQSYGKAFTLLHSHRAMEQCVLYSIDVDTVRRCEYL